MLEPACLRMRKRLPKPIRGTLLRERTWRVYRDIYTCVCVCVCSCVCVCVCVCVSMIDSHLCSVWEASNPEQAVRTLLTQPLTTLATDLEAAGIHTYVVAQAEPEDTDTPKRGSSPSRAQSPTRHMAGACACVCVCVCVCVRTSTVYGTRACVQRCSACFSQA